MLYENCPHKHVFRVRIMCKHHFSVSVWGVQNPIWYTQPSNYNQQEGKVNTDSARCTKQQWNLPVTIPTQSLYAAAISSLHKGAHLGESPWQIEVKLDQFFPRGQWPLEEVCTSCGGSPVACRIVALHLRRLISHIQPVKARGFDQSICGPERSGSLDCGWTMECENRKKKKKKWGWHWNPTLLSGPRPHL